MMTWDEFRDKVRSDLGEALFTRPYDTLTFVMQAWRELMPDRFTSPLQLGDTEDTPPDFSAATQQFLWHVLDSDADTAAVLLWLTLTEWLSGWQVSEATG